MSCLRRACKNSTSCALFDRPVVEPEQEERARQAGDGRDVLPVEVELHHRRAALGRPGAYSGGPLRQARFVDEDDQPSLVGTLSLRAGQVFFFHASTASTDQRARACVLPRPSSICTNPSINVAIEERTTALSVVMTLGILNKRDGPSYPRAPRRVANRPIAGSRRDADADPTGSPRPPRQG